MSLKLYRSVYTIVALITMIFILPQSAAAEVNDIKFDDQYAAGDTVLKIRGTGLLRVIAFAGEPQGVIEGADFAAALFSIWLGPKPISESLKKDLLDLS